MKPPEHRLARAGPDEHRVRRHQRRLRPGDAAHSGRGIAELGSTRRPSLQPPAAFWHGLLLVAGGLVASWWGSQHPKVYRS